MDRFNLIQAYVRVFELGSFSAAARDLNTHQPTISKWIAHLEDDLGVQLLDRTTRVMSPTDAGRLFYDEARAILAAWESALTQLRPDTQTLRGRIHLSSPVVFGQRYIAPLMGEWLTLHPHTELRVTCSDRYVNLVEEGVDVAIRVGIPVDSNYKARTLVRCKRHLVASPAYLLAHGTPSGPKELEQHCCLLHQAVPTKTHWVFEQGTQKEGAQIKAGPLSANNSEFILQMALQGHGIAMLADWLVHQALQQGDLVPLLEEWTLPPAPVRAIIASTRHTHPRVRALIAFLQERLSDTLPSP